MSTPSREERSGHWSPPPGVRRALARFVVAGAVALLLIGIATVLLARSVGQDIAVRHAKSRGVTFARVVAGPLVDKGVRDDDPAARRRFSAVMDNRLEDASMAHIKVWDPDGRIIWSDEPTLRGQVFSLEPDVHRLFSTRGAVASFSSLEKPENASETTEAPLLEVYAAATSEDGRPIIVETYWSTDHIDEDARAIMRRLAPLPLVALLLLGLVITPLAWLLARGVERAQAESRRALQNALAASDLERRRLARDLHDGVLQDLSGMGYALASVRKSLALGDESAGHLLDEVTTLVRRVGESVRTTMTDIYPANLEGGGLPAALSDLVQRASDEGVTVVVALVGLDRATLEVTQLCYRVIREGLRNVVRHAGADHAEVSVDASRREVLIRISDDGRGMAGAETEEGHLGLRLLDDTLRDLGGSLTISSPPGGGTIVSVTFLADLVPA